MILKPTTAAIVAAVAASLVFVAAHFGVGTDTRTLYPTAGHEVAPRAALAPAHFGHPYIVSTRMHVSARETPRGYGVAVIHGCPAEDACRADYHPNGTWTIRPWVRDH